MSRDRHPIEKHSPFIARVEGDNSEDKIIYDTVK